MGIPSHDRLFELSITDEEGNGETFRTSEGFVESKTPMADASTSVEGSEVAERALQTSASEDGFTKVDKRRFVAYGSVATVQTSSSSSSFEIRGREVDPFSEVMDDFADFLISLEGVFFNFVVFPINFAIDPATCSSNYVFRH